MTMRPNVASRKELIAASAAPISLMEFFGSAYQKGGVISVRMASGMITMEDYLALVPNGSPSFDTGLHIRQLRVLPLFV